MIEIDRLIESDSLRPRNILVVGDWMMDVYLTGTAETGQEGCPKFVQESRVNVPGGAANAARSLEHWHSPVKCFRAPPELVKVRYIVNGSYVWRHDYGSYSKEGLSACRKWLLRMIQERWPEALLLSDYDKGVLPPELINILIEYARRAGIPAVVDAKREPSVYKGAILKCNELYYMKHKLSSDCSVVTRGAKLPLVLRGSSQAVLVGKSSTVQCVNHVGAGDCFAAHLILALAHKVPLHDAASIAHSAARVYVQFPFNRPPYTEEVRADLTSK